MLDVLYHSDKFWWGSDFVCCQGSQKCRVFVLSVCLLVMLLNGKLWENDFAQKALELICGFDIIVHPRSTFAVSD